MVMTLAETLKARGLVYQHSSETLDEITDRGSRTFYLGVDPSADSMHVGQLQALLILRRLIEGGHKVIFLVGGATGMIGDPGGKNAERPLLDEQAVKHNVEGIAAQARRILNIDTIEFVNNNDWLGKVGFLQFLRDVGKYETVNSMIKREMVKQRIEDPNQSISYTEFSYMLLQAYDFWHLFETRGVDVQVGGSDQWGNIVSGVDFVRRRTGKTVYALTWPLLINKSTGRKFGKSEGGAVWLDEAKTTPYQFYQFFLNADDADVEEYLKKLTLLSLEAIAQIMDEHQHNPSRRFAQKRLAHEATVIVHGEANAIAAATVSDILFGDGGVQGVDEVTRDMLTSVAPTIVVAAGETVVDISIKSGLAQSKREARQFITEGAVTLNGVKVPDANATIEAGTFAENRLALLKRGRREARVLMRE